jgi:hypothetical protein
LFWCSVTLAIQPPQSTPCEPSPCGPNAECRERNGAGACYCSTGYEGNPYDTNGCRRECENNDGCTSRLACLQYKCIDPCIGICGTYATCDVQNHVPVCSCPEGYTGDPFNQCKLKPMDPPIRINERPCVPSPCGPNSQCREINGQAVCSCSSSYVGSPPNCKPECVVNSECSQDKSCINQKCSDPCPNTCGILAKCYVKNHNPICVCPQGYTGDPFSQCSRIRKYNNQTKHYLIMIFFLLTAAIVHDPLPTERPPSCVPSPCGPNSHCQLIAGNPACSCAPDHIGTPPNCRPECVLNSECSSQQACINLKCKDPCPGSCGVDAKCHILNHVPICTCNDGYTGDPFVRCYSAPVEKDEPVILDPCNPSPCGANTMCDNGECRCISDYTGNAYEGCRPECVLGSDCNRDRACIRNKCVDPCPGTCGNGAKCEVVNHIPICSCPNGYTGDPFSNCRIMDTPVVTPLNPCSPSPCGPNSQCRTVQDNAVCSCLQGYIGSPPQCRPECVVSSECSPVQACVNQKCVDPCRGACGHSARCEVRNHSPICSCKEGQTGDPFQGCYDLPPPPKELDTPRNPCEPSPCGPNAQCRVNGDNYACQCLSDYIGSPPNCRPECLINAECPSTYACVNNKCKDPCPGSCGTGAECRVISHTISCICPGGYTGNPFIQCVVQDIRRECPKQQHLNIV